jgi:pyrimidine deaminase RibD-like protein
MDRQLESIARLEFGKAVERISRETQQKLKALAGMPRGGQLEAAKLGIRLDQSERLCEECARIWVGLLEAKNGGHLTRDDLNFVVQKVREVAEAGKRNLATGPEPPRLASAAETIAARIDGVTASIERDLEIRIRRQQAFPDRSKDAQMNAAVQNADNVQSEDRTFARVAIEEARRSVPEPDGRPHPKVGSVVVKNGRELSRAHRGERPENHAEYIALEKKLADEAVAGATVYTTLEPCTTRNHPKIPCADRLIERKVARVVIGMLDPDDRISGKGLRRLRKAGIVTDLFPHDLAMEVEELNREFTRYCEKHNQPATNAQHGTTAVASVQIEPVHVAQPAHQRNLPNIIATDAHMAKVSQVDQGVWSESYPAQDTFVIQFTNEAQRTGPNVGGLVKAQLIYRDAVKELRRITGCWLNQAADMTEFRVGDTHCLMVGLMLGQQFTTVGKRRVRVSLGVDETRQDMNALHGFEQGTVSVRLTHADTGEMLYECQFQLSTHPPEIIRL